MSGDTQSRKEAIWLACAEKSCCVNRLVAVTGRDVWRIARTLNVDPCSFLIYFETPPGPLTFILSHDEFHYRLALADQPGGARRKTKPCTFLMRTRTGHHRCALGDLRPATCKSFPVQTIEQIVYVPAQSPCNCRRWALADVDLEQEREIVEELRDAEEEYSAVLEGWNEFVLSAPHETRFGLDDFCKVIMTLYEGLATPVAEGQA